MKQQTNLINWSVKRAGDLFPKEKYAQSPHFMQRVALITPKHV